MRDMSILDLWYILAGVQSLLSLCASITKGACRPLLGDIRGEISVKMGAVLPQAATEQQACPLALLYHNTAVE